MKASEIRNMSSSDITKKIEELKLELFDLRMKQATEPLEKPHKINEIRKTIARMKTILKERENKGGEE